MLIGPVQRRDGKSTQMVRIRAWERHREASRSDRPVHERDVGCARGDGEGPAQGEVRPGRSTEACGCTDVQVSSQVLRRPVR